MPVFTIAVHGGSGTIIKEDMTAEKEQEHIEGLAQALEAGYKVLRQGGGSLQAVEAAITILEDNIHFNAGRGSVFTKNGKQEMDAAIMDGRTQDVGAVAGVRNIRNPVQLALAVLHASPHVFLSGDGAYEFALQQNIATEEDAYFFSQFRYDQWLSIRDSDDYALDHSKKNIDALTIDKKMGTVGAVACDLLGNIAAATSTGGMTNKQFGRIGDTPIPGIGTYANNATCAISCTGHGELFIRSVAAYDVSCLMEYKNLSLHEAMNIVVNDKLLKMGGEGGMIGVDVKGNAALLFNTAGMYRGVKSSSGLYETAIYR
ncbi:MAG TPA: isoaspartyl peptidase/L-asparaginase [Flavisolibacter sp.]|jgi:beta-aspartyl-peptidase (threonine type)|nr:isoaspartyl peptidase/L-asparaginase [Flavisolibacter sp.]